MAATHAELKKKHPPELSGLGTSGIPDVIQEWILFNFFRQDQQDELNFFRGSKPSNRLSYHLSTDDPASCEFQMKFSKNHTGSVPRRLDTRNPHHRSVVIPNGSTLPYNEHMPGPQNTLPMMMGKGPFGNIEMGGMFTVVKVRDKLRSYDEDPGWYGHPKGTVAYRMV